jgi:hypothetical protein
MDAEKQKQQKIGKKKKKKKISRCILRNKQQHIILSLPFSKFKKISTKGKV